MSLRFRQPRAQAALAVLAALSLVTAGTALGQQPQSTGPFWRNPTTPSSTPAPPPATTSTPRPAARPAAPTGPPVIAKVAGRPITQADFDRIAQPYFARLQSEMGAGFEGDIKKMANHNVLDELMRRELLAIEAERQKIVPTQAEIDEVLLQDPLFRTPDGKADRAKLEQFKLSPSSNYIQILPKLRETAALGRVDAQLRQRYTPTDAQVRAEWAKRNDQMRLKLFPLMTRDMSLEAESSEAERSEYYRAHPDQFMRRTKLRLTVARLPLPAEGDSTREAVQAAAERRARGVADSLRKGTLADTASWLIDTGLFDVPAAMVPRVGRSTELSAAVAAADTDTTVRVLGPFTLPDAVVVARVAERQPKHVPPLGEVMADVKRRADVEKRRQVGEADRRAFHAAHLDRYRGPRVQLSRVVVPPDPRPVPSPSKRDVDRWYAEHGRTLFADPAAAPQKPTDSLKVVVRERIEDERRARRASETLSKVESGYRAGRDVWGLARSNGAVAETLTFVPGTPDSLFPSSLLDSLLAHGPSWRGSVQGPRVFGARTALWRVESADTAFAPTFEAVRPRVDADFAAEQREKDDAMGRAQYEANRSKYKRPQRYVLDYVSVKVPRADSIRVPDADVRRHYDANIDQYRREEELHARHILLSTQGGASESVARTRADSLLRALQGGADFVTLAKAFSQEPGASTSGGDLGWFGRNRMVKEFEDASFKLKPGELSPVVKTQFGFHIIKLEERREPGTKPFEEVQSQIRQQLAQQRADSTALRTANGIRRRLAAGESVAVLAAPHGGVITTPPVAPSEPIPTIGIIQGLSQDMPGLTVGRWAPQAYKAGTQYLVARVKSRVPPGPAEFTEVRTQAIEDAKNEQRRAKLDARVSEYRAALAGGARLDSLAAPWGGLRETGPINATTAFLPVIGNEPRVAARAATMKPGDRSDTLRVATGVVWFQVEERTKADASGYKAAEAQIRGELLQKHMNDWLEAKKKTVSIQILRPDLREPRPSPFKTVTMQAGG